jgi:ATP-binding cassette, subfamily B, bacterial
MGVFSSILYMLRTVWNADKGCIRLSFYKNVVEEIFASFMVVFYTKTVYSFIMKSAPFMDVVKITVVFAIIHVIIHLNSAFQARYILIKTPEVYRCMFTNVINKAQKIELRRYEQPDFYNKFSRALDDSLTKTMDGLAAFAKGTGILLGVIASLCIIATIDPMFFVILLPPIVVAFWLGSIINRLQFKCRTEETKNVRTMDYAKRVFYEKKYAGEIRLYNIRNVLFRKQRHAYAERYKINLKYQLKIFVYQGLLQMVRFALCSAAVSAYIAYVVKVRHVTPAQMGTYISVLATSGFITWKVYEGITQMIEAGKNCINMNNLRDFFETDECKSSTEGSVPVADDETLGDFDIENVSFAYDGASEPIIRNLTMKIHKGEKIALVGENGAGKTTLIKLLMGLYPVTDGVISVNGKNINSYEKQSYRSRFGTVFQDLQVFSLTLAENVLLREPRNEEDILLAKDSLEKAQFGDKLTSLPLGVKTPVTKEFDDEGFICSGGQAQKIAIARVFAKKPDIVILDEPSSALDPIAEFNMYNNMMQASEGRTVFFISHRLSSARIADRIFYLENGTVLESGTHDELMEKNGRYAYMFNLQARNYREKNFETVEGKVLYE